MQNAYTQQVSTLQKLLIPSPIMPQIIDFYQSLVYLCIILHIYVLVTVFCILFSFYLFIIISEPFIEIKISFAAEIEDRIMETEKYQQSKTSLKISASKTFKVPQRNKHL